MKMLDPLQDFDWDTLYEKYDLACKGFKPDHQWVRSAGLNAATDRELYRLLVANLQEEKARETLSPDTYRAILYWKHYSGLLATSKSGTLS
jgi:hypothetical protein